MRGVQCIPACECECVVRLCAFTRDLFAPRYGNSHKVIPPELLELTSGGVVG